MAAVLAMIPASVVLWQVESRSPRLTDGEVGLRNDNIAAANDGVRDTANVMDGTSGALATLRVTVRNDDNVELVIAGPLNPPVYLHDVPFREVA